MKERKYLLKLRWQGYNYIKNNVSKTFDCDTFNLLFIKPIKSICKTSQNYVSKTIEFETGN